MNTNAKLAGKRALVTGSGTGIGREIALEFARQGADVVLHYAHSGAGAESAAEEIRSLGRRSTVIPANFDDLDEVAELARQAVEFLGGVDCLVNNSGITLNKPFLEVTREQFDLLYGVNIRAQFFLTQQIVRRHVAARRRGRLQYHVGSRTAGRSRAFGVRRHEGRDRGVHAGPGRGIGSPGHSRQRDRTRLGHGGELLQGDSRIPGGSRAGGCAERRPRRRAGTPQDIARLAVFLCSDDAEFIIGQTLVADGGTTSLMSLFPNFRERSKNRFGTGYVPGV